MRHAAPTCTTPWYSPRRGAEQADATLAKTELVPVERHAAHYISKATVLAARREGRKGVLLLVAEYGRHLVLAQTLPHALFARLPPHVAQPDGTAARVETDDAVCQIRPLFAFRYPASVRRDESDKV